MDRELRIHANIDCFCRGTIAVTLIKQGPNLVIGNVGDSRAVLGTRDKDNSLCTIQLTVDLKPNLPATRSGHGCTGLNLCLCLVFHGGVAFPLQTHHHLSCSPSRSCFSSLLIQ
ncbi:hypothetical protein Dsin_018736 [Dipteronia sinensis]|uniref:PPM-type phosphatase domain-containing protein n=1 Tax=Dipteronia sinensis TaxID=43782 RepID=A0AAE0A5V8_9ROSI|nr:hypothetical protein Dsin_018736 [Dipteronia sinensis]